MTKTYMTISKLLSITLVAAITLCIYACQTVNKKQKVVAVDLGLPSGCLWSETNLGAASCEESGSFFYWGMVEPCKLESRYKYVNSYFYTGGGESRYLKYVTSDEYGYIDGITIMEPEDDAAAVWLGDSWSIPTLSDFEELLNYCSWKESYKNNVKGIEFVGHNGNSIFFPASGHFDDSYGLLIGASSYWSKSLDTEDGDQFAFALMISQTSDGLDINIDFNYRVDGGLIRPVKH